MPASGEGMGIRGDRKGILTAGMLTPDSAEIVSSADRRTAGYLFFILDVMRAVLRYQISISGELFDSCEGCVGKTSVFCMYVYFSRGIFGARRSMFEILIHKRLKATLNSGQYDRSNEIYIVVNKKQENKKA